MRKTEVLAVNHMNRTNVNTICDTFKKEMYSHCSLWHNSQLQVHHITRLAVRQTVLWVHTTVNSAVYEKFEVWDMSAPYKWHVCHSFFWTDKIWLWAGLSHTMMTNLKYVPLWSSYQLSSPNYPPLPPP